MLTMVAVANVWFVLITKLLHQMLCFTQPESSHYLHNHHAACILLLRIPAGDQRQTACSDACPQDTL